MPSTIGVTKCKLQPNSKQCVRILEKLIENRGDKRRVWQINVVLKCRHEEGIHLGYDREKVYLAPNQ